MIHSIINTENIPVGIERNEPKNMEANVASNEVIKLYFNRPIIDTSLLTIFIAAFDRNNESIDLRFFPIIPNIIKFR